MTMNELSIIDSLRFISKSGLMFFYSIKKIKFELFIEFRIRFTEKISHQIIFNLAQYFQSDSEVYEKRIHDCCNVQDRALCYNS